VISSPRVVTLDNSPAIIEQGVSIPFQTFENGDAALEFVDAVLKLDVTPHITSDGSIIMKINVSRNAPDESVATLDGTPGIAKNQVKTETLVRDGQTLVLGGIYVIDTAENQQRVPGFWKIPILGNAFRNNSVRDRRKELLIFVQPSVVVNPQQASAS
jgi:type IV pilus assembly protein PilQ